jgi:hypothetical protein
MGFDIALSIATLSSMAPADTRPSNSFCQTRRRDQRLNRLYTVVYGP